MASISKHKEGWRAQVYVKGLRDSRIFRTVREAKTWAAAREQELQDQGSAPAGDRHTLRDMLERYEREVIPNKRSWRTESLRLRAFLRDFPALADKRLAAVATPDLAAWRDARRKVVTDAAILRDMSWLRNAFSVARKEWKWIAGSPFDGLKMPRTAPPRERRVLPREVLALCRAMGYRPGVEPSTRTQETALAFLVSLRTAMRAGEILSLGRDNLDLARRVATVQHKTQHITGKPRQVPLNRHAVRLLAPVAKRERCFTLNSAQLDITFRQVRKALSASVPGIDSLHFHDARAEALTRFSRKVDVMTLAKISGHRDLGVLQNTYYRESAADIAARL